MNPEIKKLWIEALRSGEYKQAREALKTNDAYCCLGVLCDLHRKFTNSPEGWESFGDGDYRYFKQPCTMPDEVVEWAGLDSGNPYLDAQFNSCVQYNDGLKETFPQIADRIEQYL